MQVAGTLAFKIESTIHAKQNMNILIHPTLNFNLMLGVNFNLI